MSNQLTTQDTAASFRNELETYKEHYSRVLPRHMSPDKLMRMAESAVRMTPKLLQANRVSLYRAIMTGAILGLEIDGVTGQAYILPFKGNAQLIIGYKGYITLAFNSGFILEGHVVRSNDNFVYEYGLSPVLKHTPKGGDITQAYAVARHERSKISTFKVITLDEIKAVRDNSPGYKYDSASSPWSTSFEAMASKTAIRALADQLPLNVQRTDFGASVQLASEFERKHESTGKVTVINHSGEVATDEDGNAY